MRVLFLTKYPRRGASSRHRVLQFIPYLEREGFDCDVQSLHTEEYLSLLYSGGRAHLSYYIGRLLERIGKVLEASQYSAVFIQKELVPYAPPLAEFFFRLRQVNVIYDIDDAIYLFYSKSRSLLIRLLLGRKIPHVIGSSAVVLAGNAFLRDYALRYCSRTVLFPTVVDPSRYDVSYTDIKERDGDLRGAVPVIGWIGTPALVDILREKSSVFKRAAERFPFRLLVIGAPGFSLQGLEVEAVPWSEDSEARELARCDIGIMPLKETMWSKGKCGLKLLQYMASGLPVVATPDGGASDIVVHGVSGLIARTDEQWLEYLTALIGDSGLRRRLGLGGRRRAEENYSLGLWAPRMVEILRKVVRGESTEGIVW